MFNIEGERATDVRDPAEYGGVAGTCVNRGGDGTGMAALCADVASTKVVYCNDSNPIDHLPYSTAVASVLTGYI